MKDKNFWVVIPAYNEQNTIKELILKIKEYTNNIVVVVDGGTDNTFNLAKEQKVHVLNHIVNLGKGSALKTGVDFAIKQGANKIIAIDGDLQHDPAEIPKFIENLNNYEVIFSYRIITNEMPFVLRFGNLIINTVTKILYNIKLKDTQCGYRAFTAEAYKKIKWESSDYFMESEMIANVGKYKLKYTQIPIKTIYSDKYKGTTILDGIKIVINLFWWRLAKRQL